VIKLNKVIKLNIVGFGDNPYAATAYNALARAFSCKGMYSDAIRLAKKGLKIALAKKQHTIVAPTQKILAEIYLAQEEYTLAIQHFIKSLETLVELKAKHAVELTYKELLKAVGVLEEKLGDKHPTLARAYNDIGEFHLKQGEHKKALGFFSTAKKIAPKNETYLKNYNLARKKLDPNYEDSPVSKGYGGPIGVKGKKLKDPNKKEENLYGNTEGELISMLLNS